MQQHVTTLCGKFGHPEFVIRSVSDAVPAEDIKWFLGYLEQRVADGERFKSGESLQVGWMFTMIQDGPPGFLQIAEPDMKVVPVQFVDSVDSTLMHLRAQQDTVASLAPPTHPIFPSLRQSAVVHVSYKTAERVLLSRFAGDEMDSGWWFTDLDDHEGAQNAQSFIRTSLYQLGLDRPDLIKFFALPFGLQAVVDGARISVLRDHEEVAQIPGSFLSELNRVRRQGQMT